LFWLNQPTSKEAKPDEDGNVPTRRDTYLSVERQTGITPPELLLPPLPGGVEHVWAWFIELDERRRLTMGGVEPIGWGDIKAWTELTDRSPTPWEVRLICRLDRARLTVK